jgi:hypothetical protein
MIILLYFIIFSIIVNLIDTLLLGSYLIFIYIYLLSPIYYILLYLLGLYRYLIPILIVYFLLCYYTIQYRGYRVFKFFGMSLIPLKYKLYYYKYVLWYKSYYYNIIYILLLLLISYTLFF